jgi:hypothetical protein
MVLVDTAENTLRRYLECLIRQGRGRGGWGDVRGTADALLALKLVLPAASYPRLRKAASLWLLEHSIHSDEGVCWEEEVWDTSLAAWALDGRSEAIGEIRGAIRWLSEKHEVTRPTWNNEAWETSLAILCLTSVIDDPATLAVHRSRLEAAADWLTEMVPSSPHYAAMACLALDAMESVAPDEERRKAKNAFWSSLDDWFSDDLCRLWTGELWSNALCLWAWSKCAAERSKLDREKTERCLGWFRHRPSDEEFTECLAFSTAALFHLYWAVSKEDNLDELRCRAAKLARTPDRGNFLIDSSERDVLVITMSRRPLRALAALASGVGVGSLTWLAIGSIPQLEGHLEAISLVSGWVAGIVTVVWRLVPFEKTVR